MKTIDSWDWPDQHQVGDGYYSKSIPAVTSENLEFLMDRFNELVDHINGESNEDHD